MSAIVESQVTIAQFVQPGPPIVRNVQPFDKEAVLNSPLPFTFCLASLEGDYASFQGILEPYHVSALSRRDRRFRFLNSRR